MSCPNCRNGGPKLNRLKHERHAPSSRGSYVCQDFRPNESAMRAGVKPARTHKSDIPLGNGCDC